MQLQAHVEQCMLLNEQRCVILQGIRRGKAAYLAARAILPRLTTNTYAPRMLYDYVNTYVEEEIQRNPQLHLRVFPRKAAFHPYIVIHDTLRNIFILVSKLPATKHLYSPCGYRGEFASSNHHRLVEMGAPIDELVTDAPYQLALSLGETQQPFGIIVSYDGERDIVFEGALQPDQLDWIYKEDITATVGHEMENVGHLPYVEPNTIETPLKPTVVADDIVVKLKSGTSAS